MNTSQKLLMTFVAALLLGGCSFNTDNLLPDKQVEYKREKQAASVLEIPPDLTANTIDNRSLGLTTPNQGTASYSEYNQQGGGGASGTLQPSLSSVLPQIQGLKIKRDGDRRWLVIDAPAESVWSKVVDFWQSNGILLVEQDPAAGVMRTGWIENRADVKKGMVTNFMRGVFSGLYDAGTRDQYRVRIERTEENKTELYLTHFGMEEIFIVAGDGGDENSKFVHRPRDPGLEAIMLQSMMNFIGLGAVQESEEVAESSSTKNIDSQMTSNSSEVMLLIKEPFSQAWRYVGLGLDRVGFVVEDRDRSEGIYYVRYRDPDADKPEEGWMQKWAFWEGDDRPDETPQYQIAVDDIGGSTLVTVNNAAGIRDNSSTAKRLLVLIQEQLK